MRIGQIRWREAVTAAIFEKDGQVRPVPEYTLSDLIKLSEMENNSLEKVATRLAAAHREHAAPIIPLHPREAWACGCTYKASSSFRDAEHGTREGYYAYVYNHDRPEIFYKGSARFCVGPNKPIGIRFDSKFTAPEPELALVLGSGGKIIGYTLANDVSAWDIERENMLYLPQSKMFTGCLALGPVIVTAEEMPDPYNLQISCTIKRADQIVFSGEVNTSQLNRKFEQLVEYLIRANPVPGGSILCTGTGIIVTEEAALGAGDVVTIGVPEIGELSNVAAVVR